MRINVFTRFIVMPALAVTAIAAVSQPAAAAPTGPTTEPTTVSTDCGRGVTSVQIQPAARFDPLSASDDSLLANGLPPRPTNADDFAVWQRYVTGGVARTHSGCQMAHRPSAPGTADQRPTTTSKGPNGTSPNWAGNVAQLHNYNDAYGTWRIPSALAAPNTSAESASWVGIGLGNSSSQPLVQGGSESDYWSQTGGAYYLWWEVYPQLSSQNVYYLANSNDLVYVHVHFVTGKGTITLTDETSGWSNTYSYTNSGISPDHHAEWIMERPSNGSGSNAYYEYLSKATTNFTAATASGSDVSRLALGKLSHYWYEIQTCTSPIVYEAIPGPISSDGLSFSDVWKNYGHPEDVSSC